MRSVVPSMMAFMLAPESQPEHMVFRTSRANAERMKAKPERELPSGFVVPTLPRGVELQARDGENLLLLRGQEADLDAWEKAIVDLDKPLAQVEVEMQMVVLSPKSLKSLGAPQDAPGPHRLAGNAQQVIREALQANEAKIVSAPRVTAIAGLAASLVSSTSTPVVGHAVPSFFYASNLAEPVERTGTLFYIEQSMGMSVRPSLREDGSIDMDLEAGYSWAAQAQGDAKVPLRRAQSVAFRAQDGISYLIYARPGFEPPAPTAAPLSGAMPDAKGQVAAFIVTARSIKRAPINDAAPQLAAAK